MFLHVPASDRYMRPTREYPRPDICIEIEQRAGGEFGTVWDCARTCSGTNCVLRSRMHSRARISTHAGAHTLPLYLHSSLPCCASCWRTTAWLASDAFPDGYWQGKKVLIRTQCSYHSPCFCLLETYPQAINPLPQPYYHLAILLSLPCHHASVNSTPHTLNPTPHPTPHTT